MTFSTSVIVDRLARIVARPIRARHIRFAPSDADVRARFIDTSGRLVAAAWADYEAVLHVSAASVMLPLDAAQYSLQADGYLLDDFSRLVAGCLPEFGPEEHRFEAVSPALAVPSGLVKSIEMEVRVPAFGVGRLGFGLLEIVEEFRRSHDQVTRKRPAEV
jgi:hypothetical protein